MMTVMVGNITQELLFRILRTSVRKLTEKVRGLIELLLSKIKVPLPLYALWVELNKLGDVGKNVTAMIEDRANAFNVGDVVRGAPAMIYCRDLMQASTVKKPPSPAKETVDLGATKMSFVTQSSDVWISEGPLNGTGAVIRRPSPSNKQRLHSPRKVPVSLMDTKPSGSNLGGDTPIYTPVWGNTRGSFTHRPDTRDDEADAEMAALHGGALTSRGQREVMGKSGKVGSKAASPTPTPPLYKRPDSNDPVFRNYSFSWEKNKKKT